jgi:two-component system, OmpR family, sensor kinase
MRRFFADASHELRPLASLRANAGLYQQGALPHRAHIDEAMRRIGLEAQRMSGLVDDMLRLAWLDQHPGQQHDPVDLTAVLNGGGAEAALNHPHGLRITLHCRPLRTVMAADAAGRGPHAAQHRPR